MKNLSILVPYRSDGGHRDRIFEWTQTFYKEQFPKAEICVGRNDHNLFSRSAAINDAAAKATKDVFLIVDADLLFDPSLVKASLQLLSDFHWVVPYYSIRYATQESTERLLSTSPVWPLQIQVQSEEIDWSVEGITGGIGIIPRKSFRKVRGFDTRFLGWGGEDDAFALAANTLCGKYTRLNSNIYHLWHPTEKSQGNPHYGKNLELLDEYKACDGNKKAMKKLIKGRSKA